MKPTTTLGDTNILEFGSKKDAYHVLTWNTVFSYNKSQIFGFRSCTRGGRDGDPRGSRQKVVVNITGRWK